MLNIFTQWRETLFTPFQKRNIKNSIENTLKHNQIKIKCLPTITKIYIFKTCAIHQRNKKINMTFQNKPFIFI